jgi:hypothetical protein
MKNVIIFAVGAGVGSLLTWMFVKDYYKQIADEEIESVVQRFKDRKKDEEEKEEPIETTKVDSTVTEYNSIIDTMDYSNVTNYSDDDDLYTVKVEEKEEFIKPMIIDADEFGDMEGYDTNTLTYYSDGIIADDDGDLVFEHETLIGDALKHFDEDNLVYVRNANELCDYEIYKDEKTYAEVFGELYPPVEGVFE